MADETRDKVHPIPAGPEPAPSIVPKDYVPKPPLKSTETEAPSIIKEGFATRKPLPQ